MGRTTIILDDQLVEECQEITGIQTRRALVDYALKELLRHRKQRRILELKGKIAWEGNLSEWRK